ncbi:MAG: GAF domain-containing protein, partial [Caldimonas sp.]
MAPPQPFFTTPEQRLALARERYFEEGIRPSGLVSEAVIQSWSRCLQARRRPGEAISFEPVTESRSRSVLARSRTLLASAEAELRQLETTLAGTACTVLLTDPHGIVVHAARPHACHGEVLMPLAARVGVNLAEAAIGTNAPGLTARSGLPSVVLGAEHFFGCVQVMRCAAAPIRDIHGQVAGVLDVSSESRPFGFDAAAVVALFATAIENRLLRAQSAEHIVVHLQTSPSLLNTPMEGLVGVAPDGRIAWANGVAARLLGIAAPAAGLDVEAAFGLGVAQLAARTRRREPGPHRLPSGLNVWMLARMHTA